MITDIIQCRLSGGIGCDALKENKGQYAFCGILWKIKMFSRFIHEIS